MGTKYKALSAGASRNQGLNPVFVVHDELGQIVGPHSDLYESLELATGSQPNPLSIVISTQAASDADLLSVLLDDAIAGHDPHTTASLYCARPDVDPFSEEAIRAANPAFDYFQNKAELVAMAAAARRMPSREADYRRFTLNQRIQVATPFVSPSLWDSCKGPVASLAELPVLYAGLDLSAVSDLSALFVMVGQKGGKWHSHCRFWLPEVDLRERRQPTTLHTWFGSNRDICIRHRAKPSITISLPTRCMTYFGSTTSKRSAMILEIGTSSSLRCFVPGLPKA